MYKIVKTDHEIDELINKCMKSEDNSKFPGMTYEQGIKTAIEWIIGQNDYDNNPME